MDTVGQVLGERKRDLVRALVGGTGLSIDAAERFVSLASNDLIESLEWQAATVRARDLAAPATVRDVLSAMRAGMLSSALGMNRSDVWAGLRAFVPRALQLAERGVGC